MKALLEKGSLITMAAKLLKIGITGLVASAVYLMLFVALSPELPSWSTHVVAYIAAVVIQFVILTFRVFVTQEGRNIHLRRVSRYVVQILVVLVLSTVAEGLMDMQPAIEAIALTIFITGINAFIYFFWTFRT